MPLLKLKNIHYYYGNIHALKGVDLEVYAGEVRTLIGANGAGKSTTLMAISAILKPQRGEILYHGTTLAGRAPDDIVKAGLCQVPEGRRIFPGLTIQENLEMGAFTRRHGIKEMIDKGADGLDQAQNLADELSVTIKGLSATNEQINKKEGTLGKLIYDEALYNNLSRASSNLDSLLIDIKKNPSRYIHISVF